jgi:hypothetical protein
MLLMSYLVGRPGFISDPVIDTAKNQIIYAHCVAPTKVFGPDGPSNPFHIRSHSEDRKGACDRSLMPLGEMTTTVEFDAAKKQVIFHQGKTVENVDLASGHVLRRLQKAGLSDGATSPVRSCGRSLIRCPSLYLSLNL